MGLPKVRLAEEFRPGWKFMGEINKEWINLRFVPICNGQSGIQTQILCYLRRCEFQFRMPFPSVVLKYSVDYLVGYYCWIQILQDKSNFQFEFGPPVHNWQEPKSFLLSVICPVYSKLAPILQLAWFLANSNFELS